MEIETFPERDLVAVSTAHGNLHIGKSRNASMSGALNDDTQQVRYWIRDRGSLPVVGLPAMHHDLEPMPMKPVEWTYAIDVFSRSIIAVAAASGACAVDFRVCHEFCQRRTRARPGRH